MSEVFFRNGKLYQMLFANKIAVRRDLNWDNIHDKPGPQWSEVTEMFIVKTIS